jgi:hypothetical protein
VRLSEQHFLPLARFGPTTPTRATRPFDASVDPTDTRDARAGSTTGHRLTSFFSNAIWPAW